jgi:hypothetical protein
MPGMGLQMFYGASYICAEFVPCWFRRSTKSAILIKSLKFSLQQSFVSLIRTNSKAGFVSDKGGVSSESAFRREFE